VQSASGPLTVINIAAQVKPDYGWMMRRNGKS
jgi:hypothetical protein